MIAASGAGGSTQADGQPTSGAGPDEQEQPERRADRQEGDGLERRARPDRDGAEPRDAERERRRRDRDAGQAARAGAEREDEATADQPVSVAAGAATTSPGPTVEARRLRTAVAGQAERHHASGRQLGRSSDRRGEQEQGDGGARRDRSAGARSTIVASPPTTRPAAAHVATAPLTLMGGRGRAAGR